MRFKAFMESTAINQLTAQVEQAGRRLFGDNLRGYCFVCSVALAHKLKEAGQPATVYIGHVKWLDDQSGSIPHLIPHAWTESAGIRLDPTISQLVEQYPNVRSIEYINAQAVLPERYGKHFRRGIGKKEVDQLLAAL